MFYTFQGIFPETLSSIKQELFDLLISATERMFTAHCDGVTMTIQITAWCRRC